jgi:hypothetical protein
LIEEVVRQADAAGCKRLQLLSHKDHHEDAHRFCRESGFVAEADGFRRFI